MFKKSISYSFSEFSNKDKYAEVENQIGSIKGNRKLYKRLIVLVAFGFMSYTINANAVANLSAIDNLGQQILVIVRTVGYWYAIIMCSVDSIKASLAGSANTISTIIFKYSLMFGTFYFVPSIFDLIKSVF